MYRTFKYITKYSSFYNNFQPQALCHIFIWRYFKNICKNNWIFFIKIIQNIIFEGLYIIIINKNCPTLFFDILFDTKIFYDVVSHPVYHFVLYWARTKQKFRLVLGQSKHCKYIQIFVDLLGIKRCTHIYTYVL